MIPHARPPFAARARTSSRFATAPAHPDPRR